MTERTCTIEGCDAKHKARGLCRHHYKRWQKEHGPVGKPAQTREERFWSKVAPAPAEACWEWTAGRTTGYGAFHELDTRRITLAHRAAYEMLVAPIPDGLQVDHLCRNRACVNPWHLEPVSQAENLRRQGAAKTHCPYGHEYTPENTRRSVTNNSRHCRACARRRSLAAYYRRKAATHG